MAIGDVTTKVYTYTHTEGDLKLEIQHTITQLSENYKGAVPADPKYPGMNRKQIIYAACEEWIKEGKLKPLREHEFWTVSSFDRYIARDVSHDLPDHEREELKAAYGYRGHDDD